MSVITMPTNLPCAKGCSIELVSADTMTRSDVTSTGQARSYGVPVWAMVLQAPSPMNDRDASLWKALGMQMRGFVNLIAAFDPARPEPAGTLRGSVSLAANLAQGDSVMSLSAGAGQGGRTLATGDLLQIGSGQGSSQVVMVAADAVADGAGGISVAFEPPARRAYASGLGVSWSYPRMYMRRVDPRFGWQSHPGRWVTGVQLSLIEEP
ncbi:hypothetical protein RQP53_03545 [Paucibacter sp. APW11]|uniref:Uncharacterized protein n=1 Tax=Roseateles aquae TaxID=3077235 RepID=A0ABU3P7Q4_9BURK|nr:hypothetical protein [Paucibacter sp. APW11]MDT8998347.1 hypothetical protein [Paucibacter sp. APW11]